MNMIFFISYLDLYYIKNEGFMPHAFIYYEIKYESY